MEKPRKNYGIYMDLPWFKYELNMENVGNFTYNLISLWQLGFTHDLPMTNDETWTFPMKPWENLRQRDCHVTSQHMCLLWTSRFQHQNSGPDDEYFGSKNHIPVTSQQQDMVIEKRRKSQISAARKYLWITPSNFVMSPLKVSHI